MLLEVNNINSGYGFLQVLWDVSINIDTGEYVCLIGPNGAGKSTLLKTIAGIVRLKNGRILFNDKEHLHLAKGHEISRMGISYISEELNLFRRMTVEENLAMGAVAIKDKKEKEKNLAFVLGLFPQLKNRLTQISGTMSGGEQKMLAIARGMMSSPTLLLVDEPSLGLAPQLTTAVFDTLDILIKEGVSILLAEQNVHRTLQSTHRGYVIESGKIVLEGKSSELSENEHVKKAYLGIV